MLLDQLRILLLIQKLGNLKNKFLIILKILALLKLMTFLAEIFNVELKKAKLATNADLVSVRQSVIENQKKIINI